MRTEPPPSEPCASGSTPAATAAAAPPDEPPGVREVSHGFRQAPFSSDSVTRGDAELRRVALADHDEAGLASSAARPRRRSPARSAANARDENVVRTPGGLRQVLDEHRHAA